jgi:hypothetical protein
MLLRCIAAVLLFAQSSAQVAQAPKTASVTVTAQQFPGDTNAIVCLAVPPNSQQVTVKCTVNATLVMQQTYTFIPTVPVYTSAATSSFSLGVNSIVWKFFVPQKAVRINYQVTANGVYQGGAF